MVTVVVEEDQGCRLDERAKSVVPARTTQIFVTVEGRKLVGSESPRHLSSLDIGELFRVSLRSRKVRMRREGCRRQVDR